MAILSLPGTPRFQSASFQSRVNVRQFQSSEDGSVQTGQKPGSVWILEAALPPMSRAVAQPWLAILMQLKGGAGRIYAGEPFMTAPLGSIPGTPLVKGASQTGNSLITDGWTINQSDILLAGDMIAFELPSGGRQLTMITSDASSDGSGDSTLAIEPALRESPADDQAIITASPTCVMRLMDVDGATWEPDTSGLYNIAFTLIESFNTG